VAVATAGLSMIGSALIPWMSVKKAAEPTDAEIANTTTPVQNQSGDKVLASIVVEKQSEEISSKDSQSSDLDKTPLKDQVSTVQVSDVEKAAEQ
jgi:hypothetical protein